MESLTNSLPQMLDIFVLRLSSRLNNSFDFPNPDEQYFH
jgi:hypothetical protein